MLITPEYKDLNEELHARVPSYGTGGHVWAPYLKQLAHDIEATTVLDYGCGKGTLAPALSDLLVHEYDPAIPGKEVPTPADIVACLDVLEHVEAECLDDVLLHIRALAAKAIVVDIACRTGGKLLADGRPAHINVQSPEWWASRLRSLGDWETIESPQDAFAGLLRVRHG